MTIDHAVLLLLICSVLLIGCALVLGVVAILMSITARTLASLVDLPPRPTKSRGSEPSNRPQPLPSDHKGNQPKTSAMPYPPPPHTDRS